MEYALAISILLASVAHLIVKANPPRRVMGPAPTAHLYARPAEHAAEMAALRKQIKQNRETLEADWR